MRFPYKASPHIKKGMTTNEILNIVLVSLIFVSVWSIYNQYVVFGAYAAIDTILILVFSCVMALVSHYLFYLLFDKLENKKFNSFAERFTSNTKRVFNGAPLVTALILALCLPAGTPLYVVIVSIIFAEIFSKLIFGGFGSNIFNPAAVGFVFAGIAFGSNLVVPQVYDAVTSATPLSEFARLDWYMSDSQGLAFIDSMGGFMSILLGTVPGAIGETATVAIFIAFFYMVYKRALDWTVTATIIGTSFVIAWLYGIYLGVGIWYPFFHVLTGGIIFGAVFMATDPVTNPINRQGRIIFAIFLGALTMLIRFSSSHTEGVAYSILIMNMFVPIIDQKTANLTNVETHKKIFGIAVCFVIAVAVVLSFAIFM